MICSACFHIQIGTLIIPEVLFNDYPYLSNSHSSTAARLDGLASRYINEFSLNSESFVVEIGGEVYANGKNINGDNWKVGIEKPIDNKEDTNPLKAIVKLENLAVATSGNYRRFVIEDGIKYAHHIDPKTCYPTKNNLLSASIFSKECITSDANATGVLVMGLEKAKVFLELHPELQAYLIYSDDIDYKYIIQEWFSIQIIDEDMLKTNAELIGKALDIIDF